MEWGSLARSWTGWVQLHHNVSFTYCFCLWLLLPSSSPVLSSAVLPVFIFTVFVGWGYGLRLYFCACLIFRFIGFSLLASFVFTFIEFVASFIFFILRSLSQVSVINLSSKLIIYTSGEVAWHLHLLVYLFVCLYGSFFFSGNYFGQSGHRSQASHRNLAESHTHTDTHARMHVHAHTHTKK